MESDRRQLVESFRRCMRAMMNSIEISSKQSYSSLQPGPIGTINKGFACPLRIARSGSERFAVNGYANSSFPRSFFIVLGCGHCENIEPGVGCPEGWPLMGVPLQVHIVPREYRKRASK